MSETLRSIEYGGYQWCEDAMGYWYTVVGTNAERWYLNEYLQEEGGAHLLFADFAAARAQVEAMTSAAVGALGDLGGAPVPHAVDAVNALVRSRDLHAERADKLAADLAAVRKVEEWPDETKGRDVVWDDGYWWARQDDGASILSQMLPVAREQSIIALGRALAAQEGAP